MGEAHACRNLEVDVYGGEGKSVVSNSGMLPTGAAVNCPMERAIYVAYAITALVWSLLRLVYALDLRTGRCCSDDEAD